MLERQRRYSKEEKKERNKKREIRNKSGYKRNKWTSNQYNFFPIYSEQKDFCCEIQLTNCFVVLFYFSVVKNKFITFIWTGEKLISGQEKFLTFLKRKLFIFEQNCSYSFFLVIFAFEVGTFWPATSVKLCLY